MKSVPNGRYTKEFREEFYNRQRKQAKLGFLSPAVYEQQFYKRQLAA